MKQSSIKAFFYLFLVFICLFNSTACKKIIPNQPQESYIPLQSSLQRQLSVINIPIDVPISEIENKINAQLEGLIFEDNSLENNGNDNILLKVWKREAITIDAANELFHITVPLKIWAKGGLTLENLGLNLSEFKETEFALNVKFVTRIGIDQHWQVRTQTAGNGFDWIDKPTIKLGFFNIPIDGIARRIIDQQQNRIAQELDKQIQQKTQIKKYVQQAWTTIQKPVQLSAAHNVWMKITPIDVSITPVASQNGRAKVLLGIKGYTQTIIGKKPENATTTTLPPLGVNNQTQDEFIIGLSGEISHAYATKIVADKFINKTFQHKKQQVTITSVDIYGSGENLIIKAGLSGSVNGTIYLKGKPYYDSTSQSLAIENLDYDLDTKNKLIRTASWLAKGKFISSMQEAFKIPLENQMLEAKKIIQTTITNKYLAKGIVLNGQLHELMPSEVYITPTSIVAVVLAKGKAQIQIEAF